MSRRRPSPVRRRRHIPLFAEAIEPRRLLASLGGNVLDIPGTTGADVIVVARDGTDLVVTTNGVAQRFAASSVALVSAHLGRGNDSIALDDAVTAPASLLGEAGDDTLRGGAGDDTIDGGSGSDTVTYAGRTAKVTAQLTGAATTNSDGTKTYAPTGTGGRAGETDTFRNVDTLVGGEAGDALSLLVEASVAATGVAPPVVRQLLNGGAGDDTLSVASNFDAGDASGAGADFVQTADGGASNDQFTYNGSNAATARLIGGAGDDSFANGSDDQTATIDPGAGDDRWTIDSVGGGTVAMPDGLERLSITIRGGGAIDVAGNALANTIVASGPGAIRVDGGGGNDSIFAEGGGDASLSGGAGDDAIVGGDGDDTLDGGVGNDSLDGGAGAKDIVTYAGRSEAVSASILTEYRYPDGGIGDPAFFTSGGGSVGEDETDEFANLETIVGGDGDDSLGLEARFGTGVDGAPTTSLTELFGGAGDDHFTVASAAGDAPAPEFAQRATGGAGDDSFDFIFNAAGSTTLAGGDGDDTFTASGDDSFAMIDAGAGVDDLVFNANTSTYGAYALPDGLENYANTVVAGSVVGNGLDNVIRIAQADANATISGGGGNDKIYAGGGVVQGGTGNDRVEGGDRIEGGAGNDTLIGDDGSDAIFGGSGNDRLEGGAGADALAGEAGDDSLFGGDGADSLSGGSGNDAIDPGLGDDTIDGGGGADAMTYESRSTAITGNVVASLVDGVVRTVGTVEGVAGDRDVGESIEVLTGGSGDDTLDALVEPGDWASAPSSLYRPPIIVNGVGGADRLTITGVAARGADPDAPIVRTVLQVADGGDGDDALFAKLVDADGAKLLGGAGDDAFAYAGHDGSVAVEGGAGSDSLSIVRARARDGSGDAVGPDATAVDYAMPADLENVAVDSEAFAAVAGNDLDNRISITTRGASVKAAGGAGGDTIVLRSEVGIFDATTDAGDGDDFVDSFNFRDTIRGGAGDDALYGGGESDLIYGGDGDDRIAGGGGKDTIRGENGKDILNGNTGSDRLYGGADNDRLSGGDDNDTLDGEGGRDSLIGGAGVDAGKRSKTDRIFTQIEALL